MPADPPAPAPPPGPTPARVVLVTTTVDSPEVADRLSRAAVEARLAACGQVGGPVTSTYWWDGEVETATEWTVTFKTTASAVADLLEQVRRGHPYDVPELLVTPVTGGDPAYLSWVEAQTRAP